MMEHRVRVTSRTGLAVVTVLVVGTLVSPAGAHVTTSVTHLWTKHIRPQVKKLVYTKAQSDARYLGKTAKAADADKLDGVDSVAFASQTDIPPSKVYYVTNDGPMNIPPSDAIEPIAIGATMDLPAGSYHVQGAVDVFNNDGADFVRCEIFMDGLKVAGRSIDVNPSARLGGVNPVAFLESDTQFEVTLGCRRDSASAGTPYAEQISLSATEVDTLDPVTQ